jgi:hypothetical protein
MNTFYVVIFTILILAIPATIIRFLIIPLKKSTEKNILFAITILTTVLLITLFIASAFIPKKINQFIDFEIAQIENQINQISPEYTHQDLNAETIQNLISDSKKIRSYLDDNDEVNFVVKTIGINAYISYIENFCENIDLYLNEFEATNTPFTLHNIFISLKEKSQVSIFKATKIVEIIILIIAFIINIVILIWAFAVKKQWMENSNNGIVFGENS